MNHEWETGGDSGQGDERGSDGRESLGSDGDFGSDGPETYGTDHDYSVLPDEPRE